jgi:carbon storage regulator
MLVLSRKHGETIRLGDDIEVTVCQISGNRVRLAISAPPHVSIRRSELDRPGILPRSLKGGGCGDMAPMAAPTT